MISNITPSFSLAIRVNSLRTAYFTDFYKFHPLRTEDEAFHEAIRLLSHETLHYVATDLQGEFNKDLQHGLERINHDIEVFLEMRPPIRGYYYWMLDDKV